MTRAISFLLCLFLLVPDPSRAAETAPTKLTVLLDWAVNPDHAPLVIAQARGYFAKRGLAVTLIAPSDPNDPPKMVAAGRADLALSYQPQLILLVEQGLPLKRVATLIDTPLNSLAVLADGPIRSLADLKGKRIGYSISGFEDALLGAMLKEAGLTLQDVELINVNFALATALLAHQVDGVIGAFRNFEIPELRLAGSPARVFPVEDHGVPPYDELVIVAASAHAGDAHIAPFIAAVEEGTQFVLNHPDEAWTIMAQAYPELDDALNAEAFRLTVSRFAGAPAALDKGRFTRLANFLAEAGLITAAKPVDAYAASTP